MIGEHRDIFGQTLEVGDIVSSLRWNVQLIGVVTSLTQGKLAGAIVPKVKVRHVFSHGHGVPKYAGEPFLVHNLPLEIVKVPIDVLFTLPEDTVKVIESIRDAVVIYP